MWLGSLLLNKLVNKKLNGILKKKKVKTETGARTVSAKEYLKKMF